MENSATDDKKVPDHTTSVVRFTIQPAHRGKLGASEEWFNVLDMIKQEPDFGFLSWGRSTDNELDIAMFIIWNYAAKPSAAFLSGDIDYIFAPLQNFIAEKPHLMGNFYNLASKEFWKTFTTERNGARLVKEVVTVRGSADTIELGVRKVYRSLKSRQDMGNIAQDIYRVMDDSFLGADLFRLSASENDNESGNNQASFALGMAWMTPEGRAEFQDPNIPDHKLPLCLRVGFPSNFWQAEIVKPLEELGVTISWWTFHEAHDALNPKGGVIESKEFRNFRCWGYPRGI